MTIAEIFYYSATIASWLFIILFIILFIQVILIRKKIKEFKVKVISWKSVFEVIKGGFIVNVLEFVKSFVANKSGKEVDSDKKK